MKFENSFLSREHRYWLGVETESGAHFVAIPVVNQQIDYVEAYRIGDDEYGHLLENPSVAIEFVEACRRREQDDRLFFPPGPDRGVPC
jgi:hypothetical protein